MSNKEKQTMFTLFYIMYHVFLTIYYFRNYEIARIMMVFPSNVNMLVKSTNLISSSNFVCELIHYLKQELLCKSKKLSICNIDVFC